MASFCYRIRSTQKNKLVKIQILFTVGRGNQFYVDSQYMVLTDAWDNKRQTVKSRFTFTDDFTEQQGRELTKNLSELRSHILGEMEAMADTVGIIHRGRMREEISLRELEGRGTSYLHLTVDDPGRASVLLSDVMHLGSFRVMKGGIIRIYDRQASPQEVAGVLARHHVAVEEIGRLCEKVTDKAVHYLPHKDLNEFLQERVRSGWMSVRQKAKTREG